jgi:hypothetical protein
MNTQRLHKEAAVTSSKASGRFVRGVQEVSGFDLRRDLVLQTNHFYDFSCSFTVGDRHNSLKQRSVTLDSAPLPHLTKVKRLILSCRQLTVVKFRVSATVPLAK